MKQSIDKYLKTITENFILPQKSTFYIETIPVIIEALKESQVIAKNYIEKVKKEKPDDIDYVVIEIEILEDSLIQKALNKNKTVGKDYITVNVYDANGILNDNFFIGKVKKETKLNFTKI